jgi:GNAT superfamily N-acetyltransferase
MVWRDMRWPDYGLPRQEDDIEGCREGPTYVEEYRIEVTEVFEPGPVIEIRDLLCRLYGKPDEVGTQNPYVAGYRRLRGSAVPQSRDSQAHSHVIGTVDYGYWPSLNLGYIESVRIRLDMRRKGLGLKLVNFALDYLRSRRIQRIYSLAVNPEGSGLLESAGFVSEPPENSEDPWRMWFSIT